MSDPPLSPPAGPAPARPAAGTEPVVDPWRAVVAHVRDRAADLRSVAAPVVLVVLVAALAGWWLLRPDPVPPVETLLPTAAEVDPGPLPTTAVAPEATSPEPATVVAHVAGAVLHPGLVTVPAPARVADVVAAAGGLVATADADRINLAAPVLDGDRVFVPEVGQDEVPAVATGAGAGGSAGSSPGGVGGSAGEPVVVDLNTADQAALESLPGVGPATALAILAHRDAHGSFGRVEDLLDVRGIGPARLDQIRPFVTVG